MKISILKKATAVLAIITAITAVVLDLQIYFGHDGQGQMYTAEKIAEKAPVLAVPALLFVIFAAVTVIFGKREAADKPYIAGQELYEKGIYAQAALKENVKRKNTTRLVLLAAAVVLIIFGIFNGGMRDVLVKAINICTECIGLG